MCFSNSFTMNLVPGPISSLLISNSRYPLKISWLLCKRRAYVCSTFAAQGSGTRGGRDGPGRPPVLMVSLEGSIGGGACSNPDSFATFDVVGHFDGPAEVIGLQVLAGIWIIGAVLTASKLESLDGCRTTGRSKGEAKA